jgi:LmbE family N-acetylglucosaminyl deacetylase
MKRTPKSKANAGSNASAASVEIPPYAVVFGAHPDDIEFGCGGIVARETHAGRHIHCVICSRGESGTHGTPRERTAEAEKAAALLGATLEFIELDGDAHLEVRTVHALKLAALIRRTKPTLLLAPTLEQNQHPDHWRLGQLVRDAARVARYGGVPELKSQPAHAIHQLFFYAITPNAEPTDVQPVFIDISLPEVVSRWTSAMEAHASQLKTRNYVELQLSRARVSGSRSGTDAAMALYPNDPLVFDSLALAGRGARHF